MCVPLIYTAILSVLRRFQIALTLCVLAIRHSPRVPIRQSGCSLFNCIKMDARQINIDCALSVLNFLDNSISDLVSVVQALGDPWQSAAEFIIRRDTNLLWHIQLHRCRDEEIIDLYTSGSILPGVASSTLPARSSEARRLLIAIFEMALRLRGRIEFLWDGGVHENTFQLVFGILSNAPLNILYSAGRYRMYTFDYNC